MATGHSPWQSEQVYNHKAYPFMGKVRMLIPCEPWKLSLSLTAIEISKQWVRAEIDRRSFEKNFDFKDLEHIFRLDSRFGLQLEPAQEYMPTPSLKAELISRDIHSGGVHLQFNFLASNTDIEELLHELAVQQSEMRQN